MKKLEPGVVREILLGGIVAGVCFAAPALMEHMSPEPTVLHEFVDELPFLGCLIIGLTIIRLVYRQKNPENNG